MQYRNYKGMNMEENELGFERLGLKENDILVIKVKSDGHSANDVIQKMSAVRNDDFVSYIQERGYPVLVVNDGISFEILRTSENDKVVVYLDVSSMTETEAESYEQLIKMKLRDSIGDKLICVPVKSKTSMKIKSEEENGN